MKALSGYAEWFWLMAKDWKDVENRSWPLPMNARNSLPMRIYLHASKTPITAIERNLIFSLLTPEQLQVFMSVDWSLYRGNIIGEITITRQIRKHNENPHSQYSMGGIYSMGYAQAELDHLKREVPEYFSKWFFGEFGFVVKGGVLYGDPIPYKGQLGFFELDRRTLLSIGQSRQD